MTNNLYPYNDEYMIFNEETNRYVLTTKYILDKYGIDLEGSINERNAVNTQIMANALLEEVSDDIYDYIHEHNADNAKQDLFIKHVPSLRNIIQKAMSKQFLYSRMNGMLGYSADKEKQASHICPKAKSILLQTVPELGISILYTGRI